MNKTLTVSIASYNIEPYIRNTLDSCIIPEIMDDIEVIVVNDGSKDNTLAIAKEYAEKYPNTIRVIDKENGGYGTTVNASMKVANGKYFKLLDGDDWFDKGGLKSLVDQLKKTDADYVISRYYKVRDGSNEKTINSPSWKEYEGQLVDTKCINTRLDTGIWQSTVKTQIIKNYSFELPGKRLYTDQLFIINTLSHARSILFLSEPVYCYRVGRDGQSVTRENRIKHCQDAIDNMYDIIDYCEKTNLQDQYNERKPFFTRCGGYYIAAIKTYLLLPASRETLNNIKQLETYAKKHAPEIYIKGFKYSKKIMLLRSTLYLSYWLIGGKERNWE